VCHDALTQQRLDVSASLSFECYTSIGDEVMTLTHSFGIMALAVSAFAQPQVKSSEADTSTLIPTARIIQVLPEVNELNELVRNRPDFLRIAPLRQIVIEKVLVASLEVDATIAQIDNEIAQSNEIRGYLSDKRDRAVNRANLLSIVSAGTLGATRAGLQLPAGDNKSLVCCRHRGWGAVLDFGDLRYSGAERRDQAFRLQLKYVSPTLRSIDTQR
jgi:hypothetical protein